MKTVITLFVALFLALSLCSCDNSGNTDSAKNNDNVSNEKLTQEQIELKKVELELASCELEMEESKTWSLREKADNYFSRDMCYLSECDDECTKELPNDTKRSQLVFVSRHSLMDFCAKLLEENNHTNELTTETIRDYLYAYYYLMITINVGDISTVKTAFSEVYSTDEWLEKKDIILEYGDIAMASVDLFSSADNLLLSHIDDEYLDRETIAELQQILEQLYECEEICRLEYYRKKVDIARHNLDT